MIASLLALASCDQEQPKKDTTTVTTPEPEVTTPEDNNDPPAPDTEAAEPTANEYFEFELLEDGTYGISAKDVNNMPANVIIPSEYNGAAVTVINYAAFYQCVRLCSIVIPDSVTTIGNSAFGFCSNLQSVTIGNAVTLIDDWAFSWCEALCTITLPDSLNTIGGNAFAICDSLVKIVFGKNFPTIEAEAFYSCNRLHVIVNGSETELSFDSEDSSLLFKNAMVILNNGVLNYAQDGNEYLLENDFLFYKADDGYTLFAYVGGEKTVTLPTSINGGSYDIYKITGVYNVIIPDGFTSIGELAFSECLTLTSVILPESLTSIAEEAFYFCPRFESLYIPSGLSSIGYRAFASCESLQITIDENNPFFYAQNNCLIQKENKRLLFGNATSVIPYDVLTIASGAFNGCSNLVGIVIPNSVTTIESFAFYACDSLTSIFIPASVTSIGERAFSLCSSLEAITVSPNNDVYYQEGGCLIHKETMTVIAGSVDCVIPEDVLNIAPEAFAACFKQDGFVVPDGVQTIGEMAFILNLAKNVVIPKSVVKMCPDAFWGCFILENIYFTGSEEEWNAIDFGDADTLDTTATIHFNYVPQE